MNTSIGGSAASQTAYIDSGSYYQNATPRTIGGVTITDPSLDASASYRQVQDIADGEASSQFTEGSTGISEQAWVSSSSDILVYDLDNTGTTSAAITATTYTGCSVDCTSEPTTSGVSTAGGASTAWATRTTGGSTWNANAALATTVLGNSAVSYSTVNSSSAAATFTLAAGQEAFVVTALAVSGGNVSGTPEPAPGSLSTELAQAQQEATALNLTSGSSSSVQALASTTQSWWHQFWLSGATIDVGDTAVQRYWYTSLYALAAANRAGADAPSMQMFQTVDNSLWGGNWTTDYDFEMPYQDVYSANHVSLAQPYEQAVLDYLPTAEANASAAGYQGAYVPNAIGPGGQNYYSGYSNMKGNSAWLATNFSLHWYDTLDTAWAKATGFPYLYQVAQFWDNYLTKTSNGEYIVQGSAQNENSSYQLNPSGDLAWLHYMYPALLSMAKALNVDSSLWATWQDIINNLAPYPTFTYDGHTDFKSTQDAPGFYGGDANPVNSVFPGNDVGLGSSASLLQTAQNTVYDLGLPGNGNTNDGTIWSQMNSFGWIYPAAARAGLPDTYSRLAGYLDGRYAGSGQPGLRANGTVAQGGGGAETFGGMETVTSMLLNGYDGVLRLFPDWPSARDASFSDMLIRGAFEVSSSLSGGVVQATTITSEQGGTLVLANPWPGATPTVENTTTGAAVAVTTSNGLVSIPTTAGDSYLVSGQPATQPLVDRATVATASASTDLNNPNWRAGYVNDGQVNSEPGTLGWESTWPSLTTGATASASSSLEQSPWGAQNVVTGNGLGWTTSDDLTANHTDWVQLDLGSAQSVGQVDLIPRQDVPNTGYGFPVDFTISLSTDGTTWTPVVTETNYALPSSGATQGFTFTAQQARYIRVTGTSLRSNPNDSGYYRMQLKQILVPATSGPTSAWVQLDFGSATTFNKVTLFPENDSGNVGDGFPASFTISVSNDGTTWTPVVTETNYPAPTSGTAQSFSFATQNARYVRVTGTSLAPDPANLNEPTMALAEIGVYRG